MKIYHNPRCKKSRAGLQYLEGKTDIIEKVEYLKKGITSDELREILLKLNQKPSEIVRKQEDLYKKELKNKEFNDEEWIRILTENPKLIMRPIVVGKHKAVIGDPPINIEKLF